MSEPQRFRLLAPQLSKSQVWIDYAQKIDEVFRDLGIDDARTKLQMLRSPINAQDIVAVTAGQTLTTLAAVERQERPTLVKTADMLGFRFYNSELLSAESYLRLCLSLGQYYDLDKGTERFDDFMGFVVNSTFQVTPTWTQDYVTFYKEGDPAIGTPVYKGGTWYPTTHVFLTIDFGAFPGSLQSSIIDFLYYFANINVVLWAIELIDNDDTPTVVKITGDATMEIWM